MNIETVLERTMKDNNQGLSIKEPQNIDHFTDYSNITKEIMYLDKTILRENFSGNYIAGQPVIYTIDRWGNLNIELQGYKLKKQTKRILLDSLRENHFKLLEERVLSSVWTLEKGILFPNGTPLPGAFLYRGNMVIGFYKEGTNVKKTIDWYEKAIYGSSIKGIHRTHKVTDFTPEIPNQVYDTQSPEFTKENELNEILEFITSLKRRILSSEEQELINAISSEVDMMIDNSSIKSLSDEELLQECIDRGI